MVRCVRVIRYNTITTEKTKITNSYTLRDSRMFFLLHEA